MSPRRIVLALSVAVAHFAAASAAREPGAPAGVPKVEIVSPGPETAAFGPTEVTVAVRGGGPIARVELYFNGRRVGERTAPPYRFTVDLGQENVERQLRAVARAVSGERGEATVTLPSLRVDEEIHLQLRQLYVTVERDGKRVLDLERGDFRVQDGGQRQEIVTFERGDVPLTAALLVDASTSMAGARLGAALAGARAFAAGMAPLDEASLQLFSDRLLHAAPYTSDPRALAIGLDSVRSGGGTALNDQLFAALLGLEARQGRRLVVVLSDGVDVDSVLESSQVEELASRSQALVYWIRLRDAESGPEVNYLSAWRTGAEHRREIDGLRRLVESSGGRVLDLLRIEEAEAAFREILVELREQYVIGYYPSNARRDGAWHSLRVDVARPGLAARSRAGYRDR